MRIPAEAIPPAANLSKDLENTRKAEPVARTARLANEISASPQEPAQFFAGREQRRQPVAQENAIARHESQALPVERRQSERRSENRPVLLDTRSNRGRRRASGEIRISIKV